MAWDDALGLAVATVGIWMVRQTGSLGGLLGEERPTARTFNMIGNDHEFLLSLEYRHVDVFSRHAFRGNGLVVVLDAAGLSTTIQQQLTREVRQFETVFVSDVDLPSRTARLRVFTEDEELGFAGHPVLGAASVLHTLLPVTAVERGLGGGARRAHAHRAYAEPGRMDRCVDGSRSRAVRTSRDRRARRALRGPPSGCPARPRTLICPCRSSAPDCRT